MRARRASGRWSMTLPPRNSSSPRSRRWGRASRKAAGWSRTRTRSSSRRRMCSTAARAPWGRRRSRASALPISARRSYSGTGRRGSPSRPPSSGSAAARAISAPPCLRTCAKASAKRRGFPWTPTFRLARSAGSWTTFLRRAACTPTGAFMRAPSTVSSSSASPRGRASSPTTPMLPAPCSSTSTPFHGMRSFWTIFLSRAAFCPRCALPTRAWERRCSGAKGCRSRGARAISRRRSSGRGVSRAATAK